ncbi:hypothetical protein [Arthrobacter sp. 4R501]|uniref:hypothetical protein n=1 Tax=Arthrobacter sp. 4R501 TaxID=2058886 RepID=UPI0011B027FF|nr:hypothetical protein [Arthrobacter sp. 4R501]
MRASEEHNKHNDETRRLLGLLEQKNRELADTIAEESGGTASRANGVASVSSNKDVLAAGVAVGDVRKALDDHVRRSTHFVRNYKIVDLQSGVALEEFTVDYELAPWTASKRMAKKQVYKYDLQEQQPDGSWLSYYPEGR